MSLLLAFLLQTAFPPPAPAGQQGPNTPARPPATILVEPAAMLLAACDADADARVTAVERDRCVARLFATAEGANRGSIGYIAYADWSQRWLGDRNALPSPYEVDADGDNRITATELERRLAAMFDRYDANKDGVLERSELVTIRANAPGTPGDGDERRRRRR